MTATTAAPTTKKSYDIPATMKAWVLGDPGQLTQVEKPVPQPGAAEVLVRIDAIAVCGTDVEIIWKGLPAIIEGGPPFNKNFTPGHEYMGTVVKLGVGVDEFKIGDRVAVEVHAGCGRCERCREGMYTSCLNYGKNYGNVQKGHRANGFTTDGGFTQYAVNNINTLVHVPADMSDEEATLIVTAGTAMYGLDVMGGLIAGQSVVVMGPGPIGLMGVAVAKALGAGEVILTGTRDNRLEMGRKLGADHTINVTKENAVEMVHEVHRGRRAIRAGMFRRAHGHQRRGPHAQARRPHLPGGFPRQGSVGRRERPGAQQHLPVRHSGRRQERHPPRRVADGAEALRRQAHPHPHLLARRSAQGHQLCPRAHRRCHQGRREDVLKGGNSRPPDPSH